MKIRKTNSKRKGLCCKGARHFLKNDVPANPTSQRTLGHLRNVLICSRTSLGTRECSNLLRDVIGDSGMFSLHPSHSGPEIGNIFGTVPRSLEKMGLPSHISHCSGLWRFKKQNKIKISAMWDTVGKSINTKNPTLTCSSLHSTSRSSFTLTEPPDFPFTLPAISVWRHLSHYLYQTHPTWNNPYLCKDSR